MYFLDKMRKSSTFKEELDHDSFILIKEDFGIENVSYLQVLLQISMKFVQ